MALSLTQKATALLSIDTVVDDLFAAGCSG